MDGELQQATELRTGQESYVLLREVYEAARRVLRFTGVDGERTQRAWHQLEAAIEYVKIHDGGTWDDAEVIAKFPLSEQCLFQDWSNSRYKHMDFDDYRDLVRDTEKKHGIDYPSHEPLPSGEYAGAGMFKDEKPSKAALAWAERQHRMGQEGVSEFLRYAARLLEVVEDRHFGFRVFAMCDAYESGLGHGLKADGFDNAAGTLYGANLECNMAYQFGYKHGRMKKGWAEQGKKA